MKCGSGGAKRRPDTRAKISFVACLVSYIVDRRIDVMFQAGSKVVLGRSGPISCHRLNRQESAEILRNIRKLP